ncbi:MAG: hypothetical protein AB8F94_22905 [Saprospiraceae bacterium]
MIGSGIFALGVGARMYYAGKDKEKVGLQKAGALIGLGGVGVGLSSILIPNSEDAYYDALITYNMYF